MSKKQKATIVWEGKDYLGHGYRVVALAHEPPYQDSAHPQVWYIFEQEGWDALGKKIWVNGGRV